MISPTKENIESRIRGFLRVMDESLTDGCVHLLTQWVLDTVNVEFKKGYEFRRGREERGVTDPDD